MLRRPYSFRTLFVTVWAVAAGHSPAVEPGFPPGGLSNNIPVGSSTTPGLMMPPSTAGDAPAATNLVIGLLLPENEPLGLSVRQGVVFGVERFQTTRAIAAKLVVRGAVGQWGTDGVEAARMVTDDGAQGLIAPPTGAASHLALQVAGRTAVPVISLCGDSSVTQTGVRWTASATPRTIDEAKAIFSLLHTAAKRWAACVPEGRRGREITSDLNEAAMNADVLVQRAIEVKSPIVDLPDLCHRVQSESVDGVLLWLDPLPAARMARQLRAAGFKGQLAGPGWLRSTEFESAAGHGFEQFLIMSPATDQSRDARFTEFASAFRGRFGKEPDAMAAMSYDAAQVLLEVLARAGERPPHELFPIPFCLAGVTGILSFDEFGNRNIELEPQKGQGGHFIRTMQR